jgi:Calcineurin-like phosphoesterase
MKLVIEPAIADKIRKMQQRVRWQDPLIVARGIDQTRLVLEDGKNEDPEFSFLVVGDSGSGSHRGHNPQRQIAELMLPHHQECRFMLHTGDVVYLVGSSEYYQQNFIQPYREFLVGGEHHQDIPYDQMCFKLPIFPVLGNHDYYDLPILLQMLSFITTPLRPLIQSRVDLDVGLHGSYQGDAYARAFIDYLKSYNLPGELIQHLDQHYTAQTTTGRCLSYIPGEFTRLPNRYYTFRYGGIDFFALDSNTFNNPEPIPQNQAGAEYRREIEKRRQNLEQEKDKILQAVTQLDLNQVDEAEQLDDSYAKVSQIEEMIVDINKQLNSNQQTVTDTEQLLWLKDQLIASWNSSEVRGRIIFFHHPPYVTEATKWHQAQTKVVRQRLRGVFDDVAQVLGKIDQPIVNLVLNGHAHCLEHLQTLDTGHADSGIDWIVCGGSGFSLRRQRSEGGDISETFSHDGKQQDRLVAKSQLFVGRTGEGSHRHRPYSSLRIDVKSGSSPKFVVRPMVADWYQQKWHNREIEPFTIGG